MFTGIIEEIGTIVEKSSGKIKIQASRTAATCKVGDSIALNGICLTVAIINQDFLTFDVMENTLNLTSLKDARPQTKLNLEKAATPNTFLGGHIVQGHVDGLGTISALNKLPYSTIMKIKADPELISQMIEKGSVALDGVSLTISELAKDSFAVSLIPTTLKDTILGQKNIGDKINIETDILGKYVKKYIGNMGSNQSATEEFLKRTGFME